MKQKINSRLQRAIKKGIHQETRTDELKRSDPGTLGKKSAYAYFQTEGKCARNVLLSRNTYIGKHCKDLRENHKYEPNGYNGNKPNTDGCYTSMLRMVFNVTWRERVRNEVL